MLLAYFRVFLLPYIIQHLPINIGTVAFLKQKHIRIAGYNPPREPRLVGNQRKCFPKHEELFWSPIQ
jgi:hypothetical protein